MKNLHQEISKLFPDFKFLPESKGGSIFGSKDVKKITFRNEKKDLIHTDDKRHIFVSSVFEAKNGNAAFRYVIIYTPSAIREYKRKKFYEFEFEKRFYSAGYWRRHSRV